MKFLKPLFFKKYQPDKVYTYTDEWLDCSIKYKNKQLSVLIQEANREEANGIVILVHPMKKSGKYFFIEGGHTDLYKLNGYTVVLFDFNGFGESEDRDFKFDTDLNQVIQIIKNRYPSLPIFIHGVSMGGTQAILSTILYEDDIAGLIIESAASSNLDYYKHRGRMNLYNLIQWTEILFPKVNQKQIYYNQIQQLKTIPKLFIYGKNDKITPLWMGEKIYKNALPPKQMKVFETKHLTTISEVPLSYENLIFEFISTIKP